MFSLYEKVVYPGHGVAEINRIIDTKVAGQLTSFFELTFLNKDMTILVPIKNVMSVGIRRLSSREKISDIFKMLAEPINGIQHEGAVPNWNKRNKDYLGKIRTGDLRKICEIYRDLKHIESQKELSFGEQNLLSTTERLLVEEIALVNDAAKEQTMQQLRSLICLPKVDGRCTMKSI